MNKNKKGFTLIELLAVIVILAIIALIAVPVIMNVITKARISAFEDSAYGIVKAGEMYYTNALLDAEGMTEDQEFTVTDDGFQNEDGDKLEISGSLPSSGKVTVTSEGKVALAISNGEYCIRKATTESEVEAEKLSDLGNVCDYKRIANPIFTVADGETSIPACITDNTECSVGTAGLKVGVKVNASKKYDFYFISEDADKGKITLLMSENLGENVAWVTKKDYLEVGGTEEEWYYANSEAGRCTRGPITALKALEERTASWTNITSETYDLSDDLGLYSFITRTNARARLITQTQISEVSQELVDNATAIVEAGGSFAYDDSWLYANGGNYWTSSSVNVDWTTVYYVTATTYGQGADAADDTIGIRPVITISKTII